MALAALENLMSLAESILAGCVLIVWVPWEVAASARRAKLTL